VTVRLFDRLRLLVGDRELRLAPPRATVSGLVAHFLELHPEAADEMLDEGGEVSPRYSVAVNHRLIDRSKWDIEKLCQDDEVALLAIVSGG